MSFGTFIQLTIRLSWCQRTCSQLVQEVKYLCFVSKYISTLIPRRAGFPADSVDKESTSNAGNMGSIVRSGWYPRGRKEYPWDSPGKSIGVGCHFLLQRIFQIQGSDLSFLHCQEDSLPLSPQGSPVLQEVTTKRQSMLI